MKLQRSAANVSLHASLVLVIKRNVCKTWSSSIIHMKVEKTDWMQLKPAQSETEALLFQAEYRSGDYKVLVAKITLVPPPYIIYSIKAELTSGCHAKGCFALLCFKSCFLFPLLHEVVALLIWEMDLTALWSVVFSCVRTILCLPVVNSLFHNVRAM